MSWENIWCHTCFKFRESLIRVSRSFRQSFWACLWLICKCFVWFVKSICCHTVWRQCIFTSPPQVRHHNNLKVANAQHGTCVGSKLRHVEQSSCYFWPYVCKQDNIDFHECENVSLLIILIIHILKCFIDLCNCDRTVKSKYLTLYDFKFKLDWFILIKKNCTKL